jgi:ElaA protein
LLTYAWCRFEDLGVQRLYQALALRSRVFVLEQGPYQDADGLDDRCWHLLGTDPHGVLQSYLRVVDPGLKYPEPSIGRVITSPEVRGKGLGRQLVAEGVKGCTQRWPGQGVRISAQARLKDFYEGFGFVCVGDEYIEDTIPHVEMLRPADAK